MCHDNSRIPAQGLEIYSNRMIDANFNFHIEKPGRFVLAGPGIFNSGNNIVEMNLIRPKDLGRFFLTGFSEEV